jgi:hypothetical protein
MRSSTNSDTGGKRGFWRGPARHTPKIMMCPHTGYQHNAAALDAEAYFPLGAEQIVTEPNGTKIEEDAFKSLMQLSNHNARKGNFSSDLLYSICTTLNADGGIGTEVLLHTLLGKKDKHFIIFIPFIAMQCNTLQQMLIEVADIRTRWSNCIDATFSVHS